MRYQVEVFDMLSRMPMLMERAAMRFGSAEYGPRSDRKMAQLDRLNRLHHRLVDAIKSDVEWASPKWSEPCARFMEYQRKEDV